METKIGKLFPARQAEPAIMIEAISMNITIITLTNRTVKQIFLESWREYSIPTQR